MKILFFIDGLGGGGKERRLVELIKGLCKHQEIVIELVSTKNNLYYKDLLKTGIKIHYLIRSKKENDFLLFFDFYKVAKAFKPDIINVWGSLIATYAVPTKLLLNVPMINNQITNAPLKITNSLSRHKFNFLFSDKIIANSYAGLTSYSAPPMKSSVIYNGFDFRRIGNLEDKGKIMKRLGIKTRYIIGMTANFSVKKDYNTFINAAKEILRTNSELTFLCIGGGNNIIEQQSLEEEYKNNILFLGKQENVENIMNICDIGVLITNSKEYGEGISNALLEFMALGKPVIANDSGGTRELIANGRNGFIISEPIEQLLIKKINMLLGDISLLNKMGKESRQIILEKFEINSMVDSFLKVYKSVLK